MQFDNPITIILRNVRERAIIQGHVEDFFPFYFFFINKQNM